jgi:threonine/homoserine/homoserine lactone efflux protein
MHLFTIALTVITAHFFALLSPGPDFVLLVKSSLKNGTRKSIGVPAGIATANGLYIVLCLAGVSTVLAQSLMLLFLLKIAGGLFLLFLSIEALKAKKSSYTSSKPAQKNDTSPTTFAQEFLTGFTSAILNPKNLLFYLSLFTVVLTKDIGIGFKICLGFWMTAIVFLWDASIVFLLSTQRVRNRFIRASYFIDKCTGVILGLLGVSIIKSSLTE